MSKLNRIDYFQVGLTSKNVLRILDSTPCDGGQVVAVTAVIGDHTGCLHCFCVRSDSSHAEPIHQTMPAEDSSINCVELVGTSGSPKVLASMGTLVIRGYTRKGKNFFGLELNNLTEPIHHLKVRWPNDVFVCGHYLFNHYYINADNSAGGEKGTIVQSKNFYVCPEKITALILLDDRVRRKAVAVMATQDRLVRLVRDSTCEFEIETSGLPSSLVNMTNLNHNQEVHFCYGCSDGKVSMVSVDFSSSPCVPQQKWEIPENGNKGPVECMATVDSGSELYIGRSDGTVEVWSFSSGLDMDGNEVIDLGNAPVLLTTYNGSESVTSIAVTHCGTLLLCCTFTGVIFGLTRSDSIGQKLNPSYLVFEKDTAMKIESLKAECEAIETRLVGERARYHELTVGTAEKKKGDPRTFGLSALPYFAVNDSFILQEDASYLLSIEIEVAIDAVIVQSDIALDLIDCEKNSAVVSFSETFSQEVLATFRCQSNTTRLDIKIRSVEGHYGLLRIYIMTRMTPKSCQVKHYQIKPLSLHKRSYSVNDDEATENMNRLVITGNFSLNESHNWIQQCLPEVPERVPQAGLSLKPLTFMSTFCDTILICEYAKGSIEFHSGNVSTISIIKDFITREATRKSVLIEMIVSTKEGSVSHTLKKIYPRIVSLVKKKQIDKLKEAVKEVSAADPEVAAGMLEDLKRQEEAEAAYSSLNLERIYGLITDLFIDHHKLKGSASRATLNSIRSKIGDLILLIENTVSDGATAEEFVARINQFWGFQPSN